MGGVEGGREYVPQPMLRLALEVDSYKGPSIKGKSGGKTKTKENKPH